MLRTYLVMQKTASGLQHTEQCRLDLALQRDSCFHDPCARLEDQPSPQGAIAHIEDETQATAIVLLNADTEQLPAHPLGSSAGEGIRCKMYVTAETDLNL